MLSYCLPIHANALASYNPRCSLNVCPLDGSKVTYRWIDRADKKASNVIKLFLYNFLLATEGMIKPRFKTKISSSFCLNVLRTSLMRVVVVRSVVALFSSYFGAICVVKISVQMIIKYLNIFTDCKCSCYVTVPIINKCHFT